VIDGRLFVVGGAGGGTTIGQDVVEAFDPAANTWATIEPMPTGRHSLGVAVVDGRLHVLGGAARDLFDPVDTHEVFTP
jgi:N-acetylneuraminic acid mutarotase